MEESVGPERRWVFEGSAPTHGVIGMPDFQRLHHGYRVNEKCIRRLMHIVGLEAVAPRPDLSKPGKGRSTDNAFVERLWRNVKHQCVYLNSPKDGNQLRRLLAEYFTDYNQHRPHQNLDGLTAAHLYLGLPHTRNRSLPPTTHSPPLHTSTRLTSVQSMGSSSDPWIPIISFSYT